MKRCSTLLALALCAMLTACGGNNDENNGDSNGTNNNTTNNTNQSNEPNNEPNNESNEPNNDPCADVTECTAGSSCDGDSSVVCAADADGCLVETRTDCTTSNQVCMGGACVDPMGCMDDAECAGMTDGSAFCTGDTLTVCAANAEGCLVANTEDCAAGGQACEDGTPMCVTACEDAMECDGLADGDTYCAMDGSGYTTCATNAQGCLEATDTACNAGEVCDATSGTATCSMACSDSQAAYSCADSGMTIAVDTASGTSVVNDNGCNFGEDYSANELFFTFSDATNQDVVIEYTYDNANISAVDAFVLGGNGVCTDPSLTCEDSTFNFGSTTPSSLEFGAIAGESYYLLFEPYNTAETTPIGLTITCTAPVCGDGVLGAGEECDDMNTTDGDGCDMNCAIEQGWVCDTAEPSVCEEEICGNGVITASEECDDGNTTDGDGCDMNCAEEPDYICSGEPSTCIPDVCGDGTLSPTTEACDDGNTTDGDGCDMACEVEFGYECDATGANCTMFTDLGTFAAGDAIADVTGGPLTAGESDLYLITFSEDVFFSGTGTVGTTGDIDLFMTDADDNSAFAAAVVGDEAWGNNIVPAGTYVLNINAYAFDADIDTYTVTMSTAAISTTDIGTFSAGDAIADTVGGPLVLGDNDYYSITFNDNVLLEGTLTSDTGDVDLLIRNADGTSVITGSAADGDEDFALGLLAGTYYIQVNSYAGAAADVGTYTLSVTASAITVTDLGTFAAGDMVNDTVGGAITAGESDWYTITFSTDVLLSGTLGGNTTGETGVIAYSANDFGFNAFNADDEAFTDVELAADTYLVRIITNEPDGDVDAYTLTLAPN